MTKNGSYPSRWGVGISLNRKVIILIALVISILIAFSFIPRHSKQINTNTVVDVENKVLEGYVNKLKGEKGYEDIFYELNPIIKFMEDNHIPRRHYSISMSFDLESMIIEKYDFYSIYYSISIGDDLLLFKHEDDCKSFLDRISKYDSNNYSIKQVKKKLDSETSQDVLESIFSSKKKAWEQAEAKKRAEEEARKRARQSSNQSSSGSLSSYQAYAKDLVLNTYGWSEYDFECLVKLWNRESGWNPNSHNSSSGAHGIPQALPASKMASEGSDYYTNGNTQIRWGLKYIKGRYGSPSNAWSHFQSKGWY